MQSPFHCPEGVFTFLFRQECTTTMMQIQLCPDQGVLHTGSLRRVFNHSLPSRDITNLLPASKGDVQDLRSENDQEKLIINQLVKQVNALTPVSGLPQLHGAATQCQCINSLPRWFRAQGFNGTNGIDGVNGRHNIFAEKESIHWNVPRVCH